MQSETTTAITAANVNINGTSRNIIDRVVKSCINIHTDITSDMNSDHRYKGQFLFQHPLVEIAEIADAGNHSDGIKLKSRLCPHANLTGIYQNTGWL